MQPKELFGSTKGTTCIEIPFLLPPLSSRHLPGKKKHVSKISDALGKPNASTTTFNLPVHDPKLMLPTSIFEVLSGGVLIK